MSYSIEMSEVPKGQTSAARQAAKLPRPGPRAGAPMRPEAGHLYPSYLGCCAKRCSRRGTTPKLPRTLSKIRHHLHSEGQLKLTVEGSFFDSQSSAEGDSEQTLCYFTCLFLAVFNDFVHEIEFRHVFDLKQGTKYEVQGTTFFLRSHLMLGSMRPHGNVDP